jgi:hypothetical protein
VLDDAYLTAPDGPITPDVHLSTGWSWLVFAVGAGIVAVGALLQSPGSLDPPAPPVTLSR